MGEIMKILFIGCVQSSYRFLKALIDSKANIVGVITKAESKFNADFEDLTPLCISANIPYVQIKNINDEDSVKFIENIEPDIGYCLGWSQLVKEEVIDLFPLGMVGYHPAKLPNNRGRHPIIWALALGLEETASTFFQIEKEADAGDILSQVVVPIKYEDDAQSLMDKLLTTGEKQVVELTSQLKSNELNRIHQNSKEGNSWRKRGRLDGQIDWRMSSKSIYNLVRSLTKPYVGAHYLYDDEEIKVWKVMEMIDPSYHNIEPGKIIKVYKDSFVIKTGDNLLQVFGAVPSEIQVGSYLM